MRHIKCNSCLSSSVHSNWFKSVDLCTQARLWVQVAGALRMCCVTPATCGLSTAVKLRVRVIHRIITFCITATLKTGGAYYTPVCIILEILWYYHAFLFTLIFAQCPCNSSLSYVTLNTFLCNNNIITHHHSTSEVMTTRQFTYQVIIIIKSKKERLKCPKMTTVTAQALQKLR